MFRRSTKPLFALPLAIALGAVTAGCATFSDGDSIARVNDVALTQNDFEQQLSDLGAPTDEALSAEAIRREITTWIQQQIVDLPVDEAAVRERYESGAETSGVLCLSGIVVADEPTATDVLTDLQDGEPFADVFAASNIDQQLLSTAGVLPCIPNTPENVDGVPFLEAAIALTPDDPFTSNALIDEFGEEAAWVIIQFRPFDELTEDDLSVISSGQRDGVDIYVDPRYGTFDDTSARVVALG